MNKAFLIGNLTKDPELNVTANNIAVCKFTVAISRNYTNSDGTRDADFIPIVCWRAQAENCGRYLRKGSKVGICGAIRTRSYEANDGTRRYVTEINADEVQFLNTRSSADLSDTQELPEVTQAKKQQKQNSELKPVEDEELPF